jgi:hypothetical protein
LNKKLSAFKRPVRLAYQPPASSTFLSEQTSHQPAVLFSQNKSAPAISHQPTKDGSPLLICVGVTQQRFDDAQETKVRYHQAKAA